MDSNYRAPRKIAVLPLAILQVASSLLLALSARTGFLHLGVFLVAAAAAAFALQSMVSRTYLYFATAVFSVCGAFLIGGVFPCAMSAFAVPAGLIMAHMVKKKSTKISVAVVLELLYTVLFALLFLSVYLLDGYEFSLNAILEYIGEIIDVLKAAFLKNIETDQEVIFALMKLFGTETNEAFTAAIDAVFNTFTLILPAMLISVMGIIAYLSAAFFKLGTRISHCELVLPDPKWETLPSKTSAVIYSVAYVLYSLISMFSSDMNVFLLVCYSIVIVLSPLMLLMGIKRINSFRSKGMTIALFIFGFLFMASLAAVILAFFGVCEIFRLKESEKREETENEDNDENNF
jgi:hypothetical protein